MSMEIFFRSVNMRMVDIQLNSEESLARRTLNNVKSFEETLERMIPHYRQIYQKLTNSGVDTWA